MEFILSDYRLVALAVIVTLVTIAEVVEGDILCLTFKNKVIQRICRWSMAVVCPLLFIWDGILVSMRIGITDAMVQIFVCIIAFLAWWFLFGSFLSIIWNYVEEFILNLRKSKKWLKDHPKDKLLEFKNWLCE